LSHDAGVPLLVGLEARVEALLAAASAPVPLARLDALLPAGTDLGSLLDGIARFWGGRGIELRREGGGAWLRARRGLAPDRPEPAGRRLGAEAIATLAVIAMHQPVTVAQIERIRRVRLARGMLEALVAADVVEELSRRGGTGRAKQYGTTPGFPRRRRIAS
jgi:segregation and condensation protein B